MRTLLVVILLLQLTIVSGQNHNENFANIHTIQQAKSYAASFSEVNCGLMTAEKDVFFFDELDTANLASQVGLTKSFFGRTIKLLKDSIVSSVNVQVITMDLSKISSGTAEILIDQMMKRLENGESYWDVKSKFGHTSAQFSSSPEPLADIENRYGISEAQMIEGAYYRWETFGSTDKIGIIIVEETPHDVPGFYTISYLNIRNGSVR